MADMPSPGLVEVSVAALPSICPALTSHAARWGCRLGVRGLIPNQDLPLPTPQQPRVLLKEESLIPRGCEEQGLEVQLSLIPPKGLFITDGYQK